MTRSPYGRRWPQRMARSVAAALVLAPAAAFAFGPGPLPPADIPAAGSGTIVLAQSSASLADQAMRVERMEDQMRQLNGRIEELTFQLRELQDLLRRQREETEFRLKAVEGGGTGAQRSEAAPVADTAEQPADLSNGFSIDEPMDANGSQELGTPPSTLGTIPGDETAGAPGSSSALGGPLDLSAIARGEPTYETPPIATDTGVDVADTGLRTTPLDPPPAGDVAVAALEQPADPRAAYDQAYGYIVSGDYAQAESSLKQFLKDHPKDQMVGNAHFWLGESYFARSLFRDAADAYLTTYRDYPKNQKAPESLLKLGLSLEGLGEKDAACATYREVEKKFPSAGSALLQKVSAQKTKNGC
jgi:tol-pal system protein YbgF